MTYLSVQDVELVDFNVEPIETDELAVNLAHGDAFSAGGIDGNFTILGDIKVRRG